MPTLDDVPIDLQLCFVTTKKNATKSHFLNKMNEIIKVKWLDSSCGICRINLLRDKVAR